MKTFEEFIFENKNELVLYHGSNSDIDQFDKIHNLFFLSTDVLFSVHFGSYVYKVTIKPKKIYDSILKENQDELIKDLLKDDSQFSKNCIDIIKRHQMTWYWIEYFIKNGIDHGFGLKYFIDKGYDCILITEWGTVNYIIWNNDPIIKMKFFGKSNDLK